MTPAKYTYSINIHIKNIQRLLVLAVLLACALGAYALSPAQVLDKASQRVYAAKSVTARFSGSAQGTLTISGDRFSMVTPGFGVWYDGTDMWTYSQRAGETSLTTPTQAELMESNPMAIIRGYASRFDVAKVTEGNGTYTVRLTPKAKNVNVKTATLIINTSTWWPASIDVVFANDSRMTVDIASITEGAALPASAFVYPAAKYPGVEVVDLR